MTESSHAARVATFFRDPTPYLSRSYNLRLRAEVVREMLGDRQLASILDLGCGDGSLSLPLLSDGVRLVLLDLTESMLEAARARVPEAFRDQVSFRHGDLLEQELPEHAFDLVLCLGVLAHVESPEAVIDRVCGLVRPGGLAILTVSSGVHPVGFLRSLYSRMRDIVRPPTHRLKYLSTRAVVRRCERHGLALEAGFRYNFPAPGMDRMLTNDRLYANIRRRYGTVARNTRAWFGSECILALTSRPNGGAS